MEDGWINYELAPGSGFRDMFVDVSLRPSLRRGILDAMMDDNDLVSVMELARM